MTTYSKSGHTEHIQINGERKKSPGEKSLKEKKSRGKKVSSKNIQFGIFYIKLI